MDYMKITLELFPDNQTNRDILMAELGDIGFESFVENESNIEAYIRIEDWNEKILENVEAHGLFKYSWNSEMIPDQNWNEVWEKNYFKPLLIADRCLIRAPFHTEYPEAEYEIVIEPKMAFGTGNHETTSMMVEAILETDLSGKEVLDMGCGTGILAMLASMKGSKMVTAIDIDQWAYESTIENCRLNKCLNVEAFQGDASLLNNQSFDIIFANIHKNVLLHDMAAYFKVLKSNGRLFMSGFYESDLNDITMKANDLGLLYQSCKVKNNWTVAVYSKP